LSTVFFPPFSSLLVYGTILKIAAAQKGVTMGKKKGSVMLITIFVFIAVFAYWFINWQNNNIVTTNLAYTHKKIPEEMDGFKIVHLSDLHNKKFGKDGADLKEEVTNAAPDIIVITGDLIDYHRTNIPSAMQSIADMVKIAPVYYVPGNHEAMSGVYEKLSAILKKAGVTVLQNESVRLQKGGAFITLAGAADVTFIDKAKGEPAYKAFEKNLAALRAQAKGFSILLSHRPECLDLYVRQGFDLVFSGHAHGGQVRFPGLGGLFAPGQGLFPKYTAGMHRKDGTALVVSRGLGNSEFPIRVFNRPEIVTLTLYSAPLGS
jgi:predicted MPP superfamily phosphohydrolase